MGDVNTDETEYICPKQDEKKCQHATKAISMNTKIHLLEKNNKWSCSEYIAKDLIFLRTVLKEIKLQPSKHMQE